MDGIKATRRVLEGLTRAARRGMERETEEPREKRRRNDEMAEL